MNRRVRAAPAILLLALLAGCGCGEPPAGAGPEPDRPDLAGIRERGVLRVVTRPTTFEADWLPRDGSPFDRERFLLERLADELGVGLETVAVARHDELVPALLEGRGDLVAANFTVTPRRAERVRFSVPVALVREQVVVRRGDGEVESAGDLAGRRLAVRHSSSLWESAQQLRDAVPGLEVEAAPEHMETEAILDGVATGRFDATLADDNVVRATLAYRDDLAVAYEIPNDRVVAWALRPDATELAGAVDSFLARAGVERLERGGRHTGDLPEIEERGVLRVLTRNNASTYFVWRGELMGFEYDLVRRFARKRGLELVLVVPPTREDLVPWLLSGRGDLVAAGLTASDARAAAEGVAFSRFYHEVEEALVARADEEGLSRPEDLAGRRVVVRRSSHYWQTLGDLRDRGIDLERVAAPESLETEEIIDRVASGEYDLTLADSHILAIHRAWRDDVREAFTVGPPVRHAWAVRPDAPKLRAALDAFLEREYRGVFYNVTRRKYFEAPDQQREQAAGRAGRAGRISEWDDAVRRLADEYGFDWRLVLAQVHQESRFRPQARSFAGARGLLQVLPRTARQVGVEGDLSVPETGLEAGVKYLAWTRDRFEPSLGPRQRLWFALAAYNAGFGHVQDARRIARDRGLDPDRWFDHVEKAMLLKEKPEVHRHTRFGYCRCREPVRYVRDIRKRWQAYVDALGGSV